MPDAHVPIQCLTDDPRIAPILLRFISEAARLIFSTDRAACTAVDAIVAAGLQLKREIKSQPVRPMYRSAPSSLATFDSLRLLPISFNMRVEWILTTQGKGERPAPARPPQYFCILA